MCLLTPDSITTTRRMHISEDHDSMLPDGVRPMLLPDTQEEARYLLLCLELGLYPTRKRGASTNPEGENAPRIEADK